MRSGERAAGVCGPYEVDLSFGQGSAAPTGLTLVLGRGFGPNGVDLGF